MKLIALPRFEQAAKKLAPKAKLELDDAVRTIAGQPASGEPKKGDLNGILVYKFRIGGQLRLFAYRIAPEEEAIKLLAFGSHENFYRDLKRR